MHWGLNLTHVIHEYSWLQLSTDISSCTFNTQYNLVILIFLQPAFEYKNTKPPMTYNTKQLIFITYIFFLPRPVDEGYSTKSSWMQCTIKLIFEICQEFNKIYSRHDLIRLQNWDT